MHIDPQQRADFLAAQFGPASARIYLCPKHLSSPAPQWTKGPWGIVTAWNPSGKRQSTQANAQAQTRLEGAAARRALRYQRVTNGSGEWAEPALLLRCTLAEAAALGRQFEQAAVVWGVGRRAALVWIGSEGQLIIERYWAFPVQPSSEPFQPNQSAQINQRPKALKNA